MSPDAVWSIARPTGSSSSLSATPGVTQDTPAAVSIRPCVRTGSGAIRPSRRYRSNSDGCIPISTSTTGPREPTEPATRAYRASSSPICRHHPRDTHDRILRQDGLHEKTPTDRAVEADRAGLVLVVETSDELGAAAPIRGLHEKCPATRVRCQHRLAIPEERRLKAVEHVGGGHAALLHAARSLRRTGRGHPSTRASRLAASPRTGGLRDTRGVPPAQGEHVGVTLELRGPPRGCGSPSMSVPTP